METHNKDHHHKLAILSYSLELTSLILVFDSPLSISQPPPYVIVLHHFVSTADVSLEYRKQRRTGLLQIPIKIVMKEEPAPGATDDINDIEEVSDVEIEPVSVAIVEEVEEIVDATIEIESASVAVIEEVEEVEEIVDVTVVEEELSNDNAMVEAEIDPLAEIIESGSSGDREQEIVVNDPETEGEVSCHCHESFQMSSIPQ